MARLVRQETDWNYYTAELTAEQYELYKSDPDAFWDDIEIQDELYDRMEHVRLKDGGTEYYVEE